MSFVERVMRGARRIPLLFVILDGSRRHMGRLYMRLCRAVFGIDRQTVLFSSYTGGSYSDNPRAISEALHTLRPDLRIEWELLPGRGGDLPDYVRKVRARSPEALRAYACAGCFVCNNNRPNYMLKFPGQLYVQTWHGDRGFKRVLYDMGRGDAFPDGGQMDLAVSGSRFGSGVFRTAFRYAGEILQSGCPRNDALVNPPTGAAEAARAALGIPAGARVLLYAPTFRDANAGDSMRATLSLEKVCRQLAQTTGGEWICLTRGHGMNRGVQSDAARDVSDWTDVSALLLACDLLITDYSSIGGDFMLLGRPVIYYQPDIGEYRRERELYFDMETSPLMRATDEEELLALLSRPIDGAANCLACLEFFGATETGRAAHSVAEWISSRLGQ